MRFTYKAKDGSGKQVSGVVEAVSKEDAINVLQKNELIPLGVAKERNEVGLSRELKRIYEGVSKKELVIFFRELSTLISAKVTVFASIRAIQEQTENTYFRSVLKEVADDIEDGTPLSESLEKHPLVFDRLVISLIGSGEVSGNLQKTIEYVADNIEKNYKLTSKIKSALLYPAFVISAALIIGFIVLTVILPRITLIIKDLALEVPWYTKVVIAIGDFMQGYWWAVLAVIIGTAVAFWYYIKSEDGKREWDIIELKIPVVGNLMRYIYLARFADNLSILLRGGIPLVKALIIVSNVVDSTVYRGVILRAADEVKKGGKLVSVFKKSPEIPSIVSQMIEVGEETGQISETLGATSKFYTQEADNITKNMTTLIEPVLIVLLGIGVAILVFAILLPIYNIAGEL
jgi:type II secretory pathway component PulF